MLSVQGPMPDSVHVRFTKWDGSLHWHFDMTRLGEDEHGVWLGAPPDTPVRRGNEAPIKSPAFAVLFPPDVFWSCAFNVQIPGSPFGVNTYVDICTPAEWHDDTVTAVDLDLDVVRTFEGEVSIEDEDEFDEHRARYGYPDHIVAAARVAATSVFTALEANAEPFATVGSRWLAQAIDLA